MRKCPAYLEHFLASLSTSDSKSVPWAIPLIVHHLVLLLDPQASLERFRCAGSVKYGKGSRHCHCSAKDRNLLSTRVMLGTEVVTLPSRFAPC